jgi:signal transduction histidine kinase
VAFTGPSNEGPGLSVTRNTLRWAVEAVNRHGFSWQTAAVVLGLLTALTAFFDPAREGRDWLAWILLAVAAGIIAFTLFLSAGLLVRRITGAWAQFVITVLSFFAVGSTRGLSIGFGSVYLGLSDSFDVEFRLGGGGAVGTFLLVSTTILVSDRLDYRNRLSSLNQERREVLALDTQASVSGQRYSEHLISEINEKIREALCGIDRRPVDSTADLREVSATLVAVSDRLVRPLSKRLREEVLAAESTAQDRIRFPTLVASAARVAPFQPWNIAVLWGTIGFFTTIALGAGILGFLALGLFVGTIFLLSLVGRLAVAPSLERRGAPTQVSLITASYALIAIGSSFASYLPLRDFESPVYPNLATVLLVIDPVLLLLTQILLAFVAAVRNERQRVIDAMNLTNDKIRWLSARRRLVHNSSQREIANQLHSKVQGRLIALALRLNHLAESRRDDQENVKGLLAEVLNTVALDFEPPQGVEVEHAVRNLRDSWSGLVDLRISAESEVSDALAGDALLSGCLLHLLNDVVINAVKHGRATEVVIEMKVDGPDRLVFEASDNGMVRGTVRSGGGLALLDSVAISYSLFLSDEGAQLKVALPLENVAPQRRET